VIRLVVAFVAGVIIGVWVTAEVVGRAVLPVYEMTLRGSWQTPGGS